MEQDIRFCTSFDGVNIAFATVGSGPPFVKAANYLSHLEYDWNSPVWRHWLTRLASHHTLIRYDQRGCGLSDWNVKDLSIDAWVRDLEAVVEATSLDRFPLLGVSQGGAVAIEFARRHPEKVSHLILYGSYLQGRFKRDTTEENLREAQTLLNLMKVGWGQDNPAFRQVFTTLMMPDASYEQMLWFNELQRRSTSSENAVRLETAFYEIDVANIASEISVPTLVLHARDDQMIPFEEGRKIASSIAGARFVPLESSNHILLEEETAWQRFLIETHKFLGVRHVADVTVDTTDIEYLIARLTNRERDVLNLIAKGYRNSDIADSLFLSEKTVRNYVSNVLSKLEVNDRSQAIVLAREHGLGQ